MIYMEYWFKGLCDQKKNIPRAIWGNPVGGLPLCNMQWIWFIFLKWAESIQKIQYMYSVCSDLFLQIYTLKLILCHF